jgi:hypothetical protein
MLLDSVLEAFRVLQMAMNELTRHLLSNLELLRSPVASSTTLAPDDLTDDPAVAYRRAMEQPRGAFVSQILVLAAAVVWAALAGGYACVREAYRLHLLHARSWAAVAVCASGNPAVERSVRICAECYAALRAVADGMIERLRIFVAARPASQRVARDAPELPVEWAIKHAFAPRLAALSQRAALLAAEGEDLFS